MSASEYQWLLDVRPSIPAKPWRDLDGSPAGEIVRVGLDVTDGVPLVVVAVQVGETTVIGVTTVRLATEAVRALAKSQIGRLAE